MEVSPECGERFPTGKSVGVSEVEKENIEEPIPVLGDAAVVATFGSLFRAAKRVVAVWCWRHSVQNEPWIQGQQASSRTSFATVRAEEMGRRVPGSGRRREGENYRLSSTISPSRYHCRNAILAGCEDAGWEQFIPRNQTSRSPTEVAIESVAGEDRVGSGDDFPVGITGSTHTVVCDEEEGDVGGLQRWIDCG
ncbi:hypothetical protein B296_00057939 [Ensete ventricosum]|uniref:Uncharacterized protein n=1 Tax=Ensete ventricosum TaxID=4639 RepID=A0A426WWQ2_ENSVE|nr:hypothetical protein B296_00057939 [Ensete ventricosum]